MWVETYCCLGVAFRDAYGKEETNERRKTGEEERVLKDAEARAHTLGPLTLSLDAYKLT
jgi:hypothetical protein